ncbi:sugar phosphate isomerase/epimerase family protein [Tautonia sociabilis]|uniref:Sugar phosphate isomerase/epimerase n=1 Tax=Tautonia sociabilis TaxID=2080755 RepID=A0A432MI95_9BACT|nr:sugar phosphate isomerase/epimerase family protein [Tautonia sociabilis]RUL86925.1 sugar phosphate isomerase/epimerase [Tautonia sociabilis]
MLRLGTVTYNIAKDWDLDTIFETLPKLGFEGVELRTTHAHGVEVDLTEKQREEVHRRFDDSPLVLVGLGSAFEYHSSDPAEVRRNIEGTKEYIRLAHDVGAPGVKVRPNGIPDGADPAATFRQIGDALIEVGEFGEGFGVEIRVEVHGSQTAEFPAFATIMRHANHPNVTVCWNSNPTDLIDGSIEPAFRMVGDRIGMVHINELHSGYPYKTLFRLLQQSGYEGFTLAEIQGNPDPERLLRYYRALWEELQPDEG